MERGRSESLYYLWWIVLAGAVGYLVYLLSPILTPFLFAAILAYICNPLVRRMESGYLPRSLAATLMLLMLLAVFVVLLLIMLPLLIKQVQALVAQVPGYLEWLRTTVSPLVQRHFGVEVDVALIRDWVAEHLHEMQALALKLLPTLRVGGLALIAFLVNLVLVPVVLFYFLRDWNRITAEVDAMIPRGWHDKVVQVLAEIDTVLGEFLRGQLLVMLLMAVFYTAGLWLSGLDFALSIGIIAGLVTFVPYLGVIIGVSLATLTGLLQFGDFTSLVWVWVVFLAGNLLESYVLVPFLVGDRIGLHPVAVIFALLAFGQLFGFFGVLLALPVSAALLVGLRHVRRGYLASTMYGA